MSRSLRKRIVVATPLISLFLFLGIGFFWDKWSIAWIVFLLIPIMPFLLGLKSLRLTFPTLVLFAYLVIGIVWGLWHPGWIIFLLVPIYHILYPPRVTFIKSGPKRNSNNEDDYIDI